MGSGQYAIQERNHLLIPEEREVRTEFGEHVVASPDGVGDVKSVSSTPFCRSATGSNKTAFGDAALFGNSAGLNNTAVRVNPLFSNTTGLGHLNGPASLGLGPGTMPSSHHRLISRFLRRA